MEYKRVAPVLVEDAEENFELLLGYTEDIKEETAVKLTLMENTIEQMKIILSSLKEVST